LAEGTRAEELKLANLHVYTDSYAGQLADECRQSFDPSPIFLFRMADKKFRLRFGFAEFARKLENLANLRLTLKVTAEVYQ